MNYAIIQPPFTLDFRTMSKADLKSYFDWFMKVMPDRLAELSMAVQETHPTWSGDFSPESLDELGKWFEDLREALRGSNRKGAMDVNYPCRPATPATTILAGGRQVHGSCLV